MSDASDTPRTDKAEAIYHDWLRYAEQYKGLPEVRDEAPEESDPFNIARKLERELAAAIQRAESAEADAERYRWLKTNCFDTEQPGDGDSLPYVALIFEDDSLQAYDPDSVDAAIDAARGKE